MRGCSQAPGENVKTENSSQRPKKAQVSGERFLETKYKQKNEHEQQTGPPGKGGGGDRRRVRRRQKKRRWGGRDRRKRGQRQEEKRRHGRRREREVKWSTKQALLFISSEN